MAALVFVLVLAVVWQGGVFTPKTTAATVHEANITVTPPAATAEQPQRPVQPIQAKQLAKPERQPALSQPQETPSPVAVGSSCENPISRQSIGQHIGSTVAVVGPVVAVTQRDGIRGNPTWLEVGAAFPNPNRLKVVIWEEQKSLFPMVAPGPLTGRSVCITGKLTDYKGVAQIVLRDANQLSLNQ